MPDPTDYAYIRRQYGVLPIVGGRVRLECTQRFGTIAPDGDIDNHYVKVRFDGQVHVSNCHPQSLIYLVPGQFDPRWATACDRARELLHAHLSDHPSEGVRALNEVLAPENDHPTVIAIAHALLERAIA